MSITPLAQTRIIRHSLDYSYYLYDRFSTSRAAGAVNGTQAEPVGGARTVTDTNSKITVSGGLLSFATGAAANDGLWYPSQARILGKVLIWTITPANTSSLITAGFDTAASGTINDAIRFVTTNGILIRINGAAIPNVAAYTATSYTIASVMRAVGFFYFIKGGAFTNWTLLYNTLLGSAAGFPAIVAETTTTIATADNPRVPKQTYIPVPLQSDGMSATTTDGLGNPENNGTAGNAYTDIGTWGVAGGARSCSALSGGLGFSYLACSSSNVIIEAVCTRTAGVTGLVGRYADASNYLIAYHDGANAKLDRVVAGVTTNLLTAVVAYSATAVTSLHLDGTAARLFYNNTAVGTVATTPAAGSLNHGLYTTDTNATFDNLVILAKGSEGQYEDIGLL